MNSLADILSAAQYATTQNIQTSRFERPTPIVEAHPVDRRKSWARTTGLPERWSWATDHDPFSLGYVKCNPNYENAIRSVDASAPLAFVGRTGTGKTSLAYWKAYNLFTNPSHILIAPVTKIGYERRSLQFGKPLPGFLQRCMDVKTLILDDVGNEDSVATQEVRNITFHRHNSGLQTWVTTSLTAKKFVTKYREDVFRRLFRSGARVFVLGN